MTARPMQPTKFIKYNTAHIRASPVYGRREVYQGSVSRGFLASQYVTVRVPHTGCQLGLIPNQNFNTCPTLVVASIYCFKGPLKRGWQLRWNLSGDAHRQCFKKKLWCQNFSEFCLKNCKIGWNYTRKTYLSRISHIFLWKKSENSLQNKSTAHQCGCNFF